MRIMWFAKGESLRILELTKTQVLYGTSMKIIMIVPVILAEIYNTIQQLEYFGGIVSLFDLNKRIGYFPEESSWCIIIFGNSTLSKVAQNIFGRLTVLSLAHSFSYYYLTHFMFLTFSLAMKDVAKEFARKMFATKEVVELGTNEFVLLKRRMHKLNSILGALLLIYFFANTSYFVIGPDLIRNFYRTSNTEIYGYVLYFSTSMLFWTIGAYYHASVQETLRSWLDYQVFKNSQNCRTLEVRMQLDSIEKEWAAGCPSLAISTKYFAITNGFLGTVIIKF